MIASVHRKPNTNCFCLRRLKNKVLFQTGMRGLKLFRRSTRNTQYVAICSEGKGGMMPNSERIVSLLAFHMNSHLERLLSSPVIVSGDIKDFIQISTLIINITFVFAKYMNICLKKNNLTTGRSSSHSCKE